MDSLGQVLQAKRVVHGDAAVVAVVAGGTDGRDDLERGEGQRRDENEDEDAKQKNHRVRTAAAPIEPRVLASLTCLK